MDVCVYFPPLSRPNIVVGVTNPFFIKTLQHWPHILRVGELRMSGKGRTRVPGRGSQMLGAAALAVG